MEIQKTIQKKKPKCPDCRRTLKYEGAGKWSCRNDQCRVIEVRANGINRYDGKPPAITHIKRAVKLINTPNTPFHSGVCRECGNIIERINATVAVCTGRKNNQHPTAEVELKRGIYHDDHARLQEAKRGKRS